MERVALFEGRHIKPNLIPRHALGHGILQVIYIIVHTSTCPDPDDAVTAALDHVAISYAHAFYDGRSVGALCSRNASTAIPLPPFHLIVHFHNVLPGSTDYPPCVEHHARDRVVVSVGVVDGPCPQVPYLPGGQLQKSKLVCSC